MKRCPPGTYQLTQSTTCLVSGQQLAAFTIRRPGASSCSSVVLRNVLLVASQMSRRAGFAESVQKARTFPNLAALLFSRSHLGCLAASRQAGRQRQRGGCHQMYCLSVWPCAEQRDSWQAQGFLAWLSSCCARRVVHQGHLAEPRKSSCRPCEAGRLTLWTKYNNRKSAQPAGRNGVLPSPLHRLQIGRGGNGLCPLPFGHLRA